MSGLLQGACLYSSMRALALAMQAYSRQRRAAAPIGVGCGKSQKMVLHFAAFGTALAGALWLCPKHRPSHLTSSRFNGRA